jgi:RNA recognition motif-containing protein
MKAAELTELFRPYGKIQSCTLVMDEGKGISKGFGFVEMPLVGEAKAAIQGLNGKAVQGSKIRVKRAEAGSNATVKEQPTS